MHVWYIDAGIEDTPEPVYTHCLVLSCDSFSQWYSYVGLMGHMQVATYPSQIKSNQI